MATRSFMDLCREYGRNAMFPRDLLSSDTWQGYMFLEALERGTPFHTHELAGHLTAQESIEQICTLVAESLLGVQQVHLTYMAPTSHDETDLGISYGHRSREDKSVLFFWPEGFVLITYYPGNKRLELDMATFQVDIIERIRERIVPLISSRDVAQVKVVLLQEEGTCTSSIGAGGVPLVRTNYGPEVLEAFDHIVTDLQSDSPCGRLSIFTGPAGTGKTYALEGIIQAVPRARYLLIPPTLIAGLLEPSLLAVLLNSHNEGSEANPTVLIIEDGDECLVPRDGANLPAIASLLNLSEGLIGRRLDIRVLATSNADKTKIDPALSRPGRLCREVDFQPLTREQAEQAFLNLVPAAVGVHPGRLPNWEVLGRSASGVGFASGGQQGMGVSLAMVYRQVREWQSQEK